jgi:hypothetical protein
MNIIVSDQTLLSHQIRVHMQHQDSAVLKRSHRASHSSNDALHLKDTAKLFVHVMLPIVPTHSKHRDPKFHMESSGKNDFSSPPLNLQRGAWEELSTLLHWNAKRSNTKRRCIIF